MPIYAFVSSPLDYCNALYVELPSKTTQKLQLVLNTATPLLSGSSQWEHILPILKQLHWLPVCFQVQFNMLFVTFKVLHILTYLKDCHHISYIPMRCPPVLTNQFSQCLACLASTRANAFKKKIIVPTHQNELPEEVRGVPLLEVFRECCKAILFTNVCNGV